VARVSGELFTRIADRDGPSGLAAIVAARPLPLVALEVPAGALFVALHEPGNPGNVGTIIRTASAVGAAGVILTGAAADPYDPVAVKASMGALFEVPVAAVASAAEFLDWSASRQVTVAAASARGDRSCWEAEFPMPLALLLGSEGAGLPDALLDQAGLHVRIPMTGTAESLNLAVAAGVLLYEVRRRTGLAPPAGPPL
jgi:RNA methyltransferase, TrmH family